MLVLSRRPGERISINDGEIVITFIRTCGSKLKIGIEADRDKYRILREELREAIEECRSDLVPAGANS